MLKNLDMGIGGIKVVCFFTSYILRDCIRSANRVTNHR